MQESLKPTARSRALLATAGSTLLILTMLYASTKVNPVAVEEVTTRLGAVGPALVYLLILSTQVIAPLSGAMFLLIGIKMYGYLPALLIFYLASMSSAGIDFAIARRFGRPAVRKLVGKKTLARIDELSEVDERNLLIVSRIFGYYFFDIISYALGFTNIRFRKFFLYTMTFSCIPIAIQYLVFRDVNLDTLEGVLFYYGSVFVTGILFLHIFYRLFVPKRRPPAPSESAIDA